MTRIAGKTVSLSTSRECRASLVLVDLRRLVDAEIDLVIFELLSDFFGHLEKGRFLRLLVENELSVSKRELY